MKKEEIATLVKYRIEQAKIALADARFLLDGNRSPQSIVNRSYYANRKGRHESRPFSRFICGSPPFTYRATILIQEVELVAPPSLAVMKS